jgi:hypothetical protein
MANPVRFLHMGLKKQKSTLLCDRKESQSEKSASNWQEFVKYGLKGVGREMSIFLKAS